MKQTESILQQHCIRWFDYKYPKFSQLLFAIPNAGKRSYKTGNRMRAEGLRKGIPDLFLAVAHLHWHGLFIEMKTDKGKLSPEQQSFIGKVEYNYKCVVCRSFDDFEREINLYLT